MAGALVDLSGAGRLRDRAGIEPLVLCGNVPEALLPAGIERVFGPWRVRWIEGVARRNFVVDVHYLG